MKRYGMVIAALLAVSCATARAQMIEAGTQEINVQGLVDFDSAAGTLIDLSLMYGIFAADGIEIGGVAGVTDDDHHTVWRLAAVGEYDYDLGLELVPYLGLRLGLATYETEPGGARESQDGWAVLVAGLAGCKYFLAENVALDAALNVEWATDDIYPDDDDFENTDIKLTLGLRFFF